MYFWFSTQSEKERHTITTSFFHNLYKGDGFPKDYFEFLLKVMQIIKVLKQVRQLKIEFQQIGEPQPLNPPSKFTIIVRLLSYLSSSNPFLILPKIYKELFSFVCLLIVRIKIYQVGILCQWFIF